MLITSRFERLFYIEKSSFGKLVSLEDRRNLNMKKKILTLTIGLTALVFSGCESTSNTNANAAVRNPNSNTAVVVNNNGVILRGNITIVPARPDIFTDLITPGPNGRARIFNATNRVLTREPFTVRTFRLRGSRLVPSVLRVYLTGVNNISASAITVRIGSTVIPAASIVSAAVLVEPGVYTIDFTLPPEIAGAGDQPIVVSVLVNGIVYTSRLDDTAPRLFIL